ncbi:hypothetical protein B0H14DRAFT_2609966 [Mycena olivaceomarginata]|nr:hypothetical protein B0H14DRAFT_2609966 [Mycena olivaceomarginata]
MGTFFPLTTSSLPLVLSLAPRARAPGLIQLSLSPQCFKSSKSKLVVVCQSLVLWCYRIEPDAWFFSPSRSSSCKAPSFKPSKPQVSRFRSSRSQAALRLLAESSAPGTHGHGNENSEESGGGGKGTR